jgi:hypothetical protein
MAMYRPTYISLAEAARIVQERTGHPDSLRTLVWSALRERVLEYRWYNEQRGTWDNRLLDHWWDDPQWSANILENADAEGHFLVPRSDIDRLWPETPALERPKGKGGRPQLHNWDGAFAFCGWWAATNRLPDEKERLVELVLEWFDKQEGGAPKDTEGLRKRVWKIYDQLKLLKVPK